jgi:hypothetical protein
MFESHRPGTPVSHTQPKNTELCQPNCTTSLTREQSLLLSLHPSLANCPVQHCGVPQRHSAGAELKDDQGAL